MFVKGTDTGLVSDGKMSGHQTNYNVFGSLYRVLMSKV